MKLFLGYPHAIFDLLIVQCIGKKELRLRLNIRFIFVHCLSHNKDIIKFKYLINMHLYLIIS